MKHETLLVAAIESALQLYLKQDPAALERLAKLEGKVIEVRVHGIVEHLFFLPHRNGVQVLAHYEGEADTTLTGGALSFGRLMLGSREDTLFEGAVEILGDTETGQMFHELISGVELDWEEKLSTVSGDAIAFQAGKLAANANSFFKQSASTLQHNISEYLQEEMRLLPTRIESVYFMDDVDALRAAVDRLDARMQRLTKNQDDSR